MVQYGNKCEYSGCGKWSQVDKRVSFFRFPVNDQLRCRQWALNCRRTELLALPREKLHCRYVCARHFPPHAFMNGLRNRKTHDATPVPFGCPVPILLPTLPQVEFKPEMWEDKSEGNEALLIKAKRPRGRPRKKTITDENINKKLISDENVNVNGNNNAIGSSGMFSESVTCSALACPNTSDTHVMNRLPDISSLRNLWVQKIDRLAWVPETDSALCEIHFDSDMWDYNEAGEKSLKNDAVPTLFLHGEAIKSWVTLDTSDKVNNMDTMDKENGYDQDITDYSLEESDRIGEDQTNDEQLIEDDVYVKREALEPEIDMVEGSEEVVSRDDNTQPTEQFETIFCDTTFPDRQLDSMEPKSVKEEVNNFQDTVSTEDFENPLSPDGMCIDSQAETNQLEIPDEDEDTFKVNITNVKSLKGAIDNQLFGISESFDNPKPTRRRNSDQLTSQFECPICERKLSRRKNLEIHIKKLHPNGELTPSQQRLKQLREEENKNVEQAQCFRVLPPSPTPPPLHVVQPQSTMVNSPRPSNPSPAGGEMKNQILLYVANPLPEQPPPPPPASESLTFTVNVSNVPPEKRLALRLKLRELVDAVIHRNLNPERIIIAYDGT